MLFIQRCPTGVLLDVFVGSEAETVVSVKEDKEDVNPVKFAPLIAGRVPVILAAGIFVKLAAPVSYTHLTLPTKA